MATSSFNQGKFVPNFKQYDASQKLKQTPLAHKNLEPRFSVEPSRICECLI